MHILPDHPRAVADITSTRGPCIPRMFYSMLLDHQSFKEKGRGDLKKAKLFNNCIKYPFLTYHYHRFVKTCNTVYLHVNMCIHLFYI